MRALMRARQEIKRDEDNAKKRAWYVANKELTRQRSAQYRAENKDKIAARDAQYQARVAEQLRIKKAAYYAKNKDRAKARMAAWHAENPDAIAKYRSKNRERMNATSKAWRNSHPEAGRIYKQNRRARKRENGGALSVGIVEKLFRLQRGKCACCKKPLGNGYHLDHIIPLKLGGKNIDENVQLLTRLCNMQNHAKDPVDFMQERGFLF
jgi:5-methylcytosine-specific restriction endonuclease McrA